VHIFCSIIVTTLHYYNIVTAHYLHINTIIRTAILSIISINLNYIYPALITLRHYIYDTIPCTDII